MTLTPAYGRDYKSKEAVLQHWEAEKDFLLDGRPINRQQCKDQQVFIRYNKLKQKVLVQS